MHKRALKKADKEHSSPVLPDRHFGQYLKEERLRQGLSLDAISRQTGIKQRHLLALEEGARRSLPADAFNRGFIRLYAEAMGISPQKPLEEYERQWGFSNGMRGAQTFLSGEHMAERSSLWADRQVLSFIGLVLLFATAVLVVTIFLPQRTKHLKEANLTTAGRSEFKHATVVAPAPSKHKAQEIPQTELIASSSLERFGKDTPPTPTVPPPSTNTLHTPLRGSTTHPLVQEDALETLEAPAHPSSPSQELDTIPQDKAPAIKEAPRSITETRGATPPSIATKTLPQDTDEQRISPPPASAVYILEARFTERTWLRIKTDNKEAAEYIFEPGDTKVWKADTALRLFLGNAGGVELTFNGTRLQLGRKSGQTLKLTLP